MGWERVQLRQCAWGDAYFVHCANGRGVAGVSNHQMSYICCDIHTCDILSCALHTQTSDIHTCNIHTYDICRPTCDVHACDIYMYDIHTCDINTCDILAYVY